MRRRMRCESDESGNVLFRKSREDYFSSLVSFRLVLIVQRLTLVILYRIPTYVHLVASSLTIPKP